MNIVKKLSADGGMLGAGSIVIGMLILSCIKQPHALELGIATECIQYDHNLSVLLEKLAIYRSVDESLFHSIINHLDRLVYRNHVISREEVQADLRDRCDGFIFFKLCMASLEKFIQKVSKVSNAHTTVAIHRIYLAIRDQVYLHWKWLLRLTSNL